MDLRDIFGRAFNRGEEWTPGEGDNDSGWNGGPRRPELRLPKIPKLWLVIGLLFVLFSIVLPVLAGIVTDYWWFQSHAEPSRVRVQRQDGGAADRACLQRAALGDHCEETWQKFLALGYNNACAVRISGADTRF